MLGKSDWGSSGLRSGPNTADCFSVCACECVFLFSFGFMKVPRFQDGSFSAEVAPGTTSRHKNKKDAYSSDFAVLMPTERDRNSN